MKNMTIGKKLALAFVGLWLVGSSLLVFLLYQHTKNQQVDEIRIRIRDYAALAAMNVPMEDHIRLLNPEDEATEAYETVVTALRHIRANSTDIRFVYTARKNQDGAIVFIADAEENEADRSHLGDVYDEAPPLLIEVIDNPSEPLVETEFHEDQWGRFLSAFAPVFTSDGKCDGVVGVDISLERVQGMMHKLLWRLILFLVLSTLLVIPVAVLFSRSLVRPIQRMAALLKIMVTGDVAVNVEQKDVKRSDEIGSLAASFQQLIKAQQEKTEIMQAIAAGDLTRYVPLASEKDLVGKALLQMRLSIEALTRDTTMLVGAALQGNLSVRANASIHQGDFRAIVEGINQTLDALVNPLNVAARYVERISRGDIPGKITDEYNGDFNEIKNNLNTCIDAVNAMVRDVTHLVQAGSSGHLSVRVDTAAHHGDFRKIVQGMNDTLDNVLTPMQEGMAVISRLSHSEFVRMEKEYAGDYAIIRNNVNHVSDTLLSITGQFEQLAQAIDNGDLAFRGKVDLFNGSYRRIVEIVNTVLEAIACPILETGEVLASAARQDLTVRVVGDYKGQLALLKENVNATMEKFNEALTQVSDTVMQVNSGAEQISDAAQSLSQGATEQASSLEEITSSVTEIASQTKTNAENANQANSLADSVRKAAEKGSGQMSQMVESMESINASSAQIAKIIKVIDDIAFQTNLLALNAAVEAARAGRHGKGFAVVADEVRNLAGRSAKAAKETAELIESSGVKTQAGMQVANATAESFKDIVSGIVKTNDLVGEIAAASSEQAQGVAQVNLGLGQVDQVTQQNTANAEETASAAEELSSQATHLQGLISKFRLRKQTNEKSVSSRQIASPSKTPAKALPQSKAGAPKGWEKASGASDPKEIIHLDDPEFGKY